MNSISILNVDNARFLCRTIEPDTWSEMSPMAKVKLMRVLLRHGSLDDVSGLARNLDLDAWGLLTDDECKQIFRSADDPIALLAICPWALVNMSEHAKGLILNEMIFSADVVEDEADEAPADAGPVAQ